jgi:hypothetical protein
MDIVNIKSSNMTTIVLFCIYHHTYLNCFLKGILMLIIATYIQLR